MLAHSKVLLCIIAKVQPDLGKEQVPQQLLYELHQRKALLSCRLVDACVDKVLVQHGATTVHGGSIGLLLVNLLLFLSLLLGFNILS